eukprot:8911789-Heterocapsa_arctica.AAC.1
MGQGGVRVYCEQAGDCGGFTDNSSTGRGGHAGAAGQDIVDTATDHGERHRQHRRTQEVELERGLENGHPKGTD